MSGYKEVNLLSDEEQQGYFNALREVNEYLSNMLFQFCLDNNIGVMVGSRIKDNESLKNKILKKKKINVGEIHDIAGVRIIFSAYENVCDLNDFKRFIEEIFESNKSSSSFDVSIKEKLVKIYHILSTFDANCDNQIILDFVDYIKNDNVYEVERERDYIKSPKSNGYQSYQFVIKASNGYEVEIQVRNFLQHFWAELEHKFVYKYNDVSDDVKVFFVDTVSLNSPDLTKSKQKVLLPNKQS